jgi:4-amino-4-deoxy-L-arabinose transferase-like glycosyltransferase
MAPRFNLTSPALLAALAVAFILPGLAGHDLWKSQDAIALGIVHDMAVRGDWIVPHIAGRPWLEDSPLYHWVALAFGAVFRFAMEFQTAARLASGAFVAAAFALVYRAGRDWAGNPDEPGTHYEKGRISGAAALLLVLSAVGLMVRAHEALPELASLAAVCGALAALPHATARPGRAGAAFGVALGLAFLAGSWIAPLALLIAAAAAHAACPSWRTRGAGPFLAATLACGAPVALSWPLALALRAPDAFSEWLRYLRYVHGSVAENAHHLVTTASWSTWPAWPLALWSAWSLRRHWREPRLFVPGATLLAMMALQIARGQPQDESLLPLLPALALLAAPGLFTLRRGAVAALDWFGVLTFAFFTGLIWIGYLALTLGAPGPVARNLENLAPGFAAHVHPVALVLALALAAAWVYLVFFTPFNPMRSVARWAGGIVLLWATFALLLMPWVDYQRSYRSVAQELRGKIPPGIGCLAERSLGISQAAALDYHGDIRPRPFDSLNPAACPLVLVQGEAGYEFGAPPPVGKRSWAKLADVGRPGDRSERYRLYQLQK